MDCADQDVHVPCLLRLLAVRLAQIDAATGELGVVERLERDGAVVVAVPYFVAVTPLALLLFSHPLIIVYEGDRASSFVPERAVALDDGGKVIRMLHKTGHRGPKKTVSRARPKSDHGIVGRLPLRTGNTGFGSPPIKELLGQYYRPDERDNMVDLPEVDGCPACPVQLGGPEVLAGASR